MRHSRQWAIAKCAPGALISFTKWLLVYLHRKLTVGNRKCRISDLKNKFMTLFFNFILNMEDLIQSRELSLSIYYITEKLGASVTKLKSPCLEEFRVHCEGRRYIN